MPATNALVCTKGAKPKGLHMAILQEEKVPRVLPPLVQTPEMNERTMKTTCKIVEKLLPTAQPGRLSTTTNNEIENGIDVCAFALCWYVAAFRDSFRRDLLMKNFLEKVFSLVCATEAAGISITEGIDIREAFRRVAERRGIENVKGAASAKRDGQASSAVKRPRNRRFRLRSRGEQTAQQREANPVTKEETRSQRLPPLVIWPSIPKRCAKQVAQLLSDIDGETTPGRLSTTSDESIEELARASRLALCWFLGSHGDMSKADQIALRWAEDLPRLVGLTCAIARAEQTGVTVRQALGTMDVSAKCEDILGGETCICWLDEAGNTRISGPKEVQTEMDQAARAHDFLQNVSDVIGTDVNTVDPDVLDGILRHHHQELTELVADGCDFDVSEHEFQARKQSYYSDDGVISQMAMRAADWNVDRAKKLKPAIQRSILIRLHMMEAKIEKRRRIRLN
jgi:hypothetical protein